MLQILENMLQILHLLHFGLQQIEKCNRLLNATKYTVILHRNMQQILQQMSATINLYQSRSFFCNKLNIETNFHSTSQSQNIVSIFKKLQNLDLSRLLHNFVANTFQQGPLLQVQKASLLQARAKFIAFGRLVCCKLERSLQHLVGQFVASSSEVYSIRQASLLQAREKFIAFGMI